MGDIMKNVLTFILLALVYSQAFAGYTGPNPNFNSVGIDTTLRADELGSAPTTPAANSWKLYFKSSGPYVIDDVGTETGLFDFVPDSRTITTTAPLLIDGGASADLSANRTLSIPVATSSVDGYLDNADWTTFNGKQSALVNSAGLASAINDETGTGVAVFSASPALTGNPTAPTQAPNDNSTKIATTAYVDSAIIGGATFDAFTYDGVTFPYFKTGETELGLNTWFSSATHTVTSGVAQSSDGTYFIQYMTVPPYLLIQKLVSGVYRNLELPSTLPTGTVRSASFSPDGNFLAIAHSISPYLTVYERSGDTFTKISDPATLPTGNGFSVAWDETSTYLAIAHFTTPFVTVYERSGSTLTKLSDPATLPTGSGGGVSWGNNSGVSLLAVSHETSPFVTIYSRSGSTLTKLTNPAQLPTGGAGTQGAVSFSSDGAWLAVAHSVSPFVTVYSVTGGGSSITKISNPVQLPTSTCTSADWSANTNYLALTCNATDVSVVYYRSGSTLTKLTDPTYLFEASTSSSVDKTAMFSNRDQNYLIVASQYSPPQLYSYTSSALSNYNHSDDFTNLTTTTSAGGIVADIKQSINGGIVATANSLTPFMAVYSKTGSILDKLSDPATLPTGTGRGVGIHPSNKFIAVAHSVSPFVSIYSLYGRTLTKLTNPVTLPTGIAHVAEFSNSGEFLAVGHEVSPFISVYQKSGTAFTKLTNPVTLPTNTVTQVGWTHDDKYLIVGFNASPYVAVYEKSGTTLTKLSDPSTLPVSQSLSGNSQIITSPNDYKFVFQESVVNTNYGKTLIYSISGSTVSVEFDSIQNNILVGDDANPIKYWGVDNVLGICNRTVTNGPAQLMYFKYEGVSGFTPYKTTLLPADIGCDSDSYFSLEGRTVISDDAGASISIIENTNLPSGSPSVLHNYGYGMK